MKILSILTISAVMALAAQPALAADADAGKAAFTSKGCAGCHGDGGAAPTPGNPKLAGKGAAAIKKALADFKSGARKNPTMNAMAGMLSDADVDNIAAYLGAQK